MGAALRRQDGAGVSIIARRIVVTRRSSQRDLGRDRARTLTDLGRTIRDPGLCQPDAALLGKRPPILRWNGIKPTECLLIAFKDV